jgi:hypothetical protein
LLDSIPSIDVKEIAQHSATEHNRHKQIITRKRQWKC